MYDSARYDRVGASKGGECIEEQAYLGKKSISFFEVIEERMGRAITAAEMTQALEIICGQASEEQINEIIDSLKRG